MKLKGNLKGKFVGLSSFMAVFVLLAAAVFCPFDGNNANAAMSQSLSIDFVLRQALDSKKLTIDFFLSESGGIAYDKIAKKLGIEFILNEKINIGMSGLGNVNEGQVAPTVGGTEITGETTFKAGTNNPNGLAVNISGNPEMTNENSDYAGSEYAKVKPVAGKVDSAALLAVNTWGYNLVKSGEKDTSLYPVKAAGETKGYKTGEYDFVLKFGAKVNTGVAAGTYSSKVDVNVSPSATAVAERASVMRTIDNALDEYFVENPDEKEKFDQLQAKLKTKYETEQRGEVFDEEAYDAEHGIAAE